MPSPSVTYTFANSTTADATQVNQNFTDLINGMSDGTKDFSINALTVAGAATLNGNVALGNASGDDVTMTGSLASSIAVKTNATYNIGGATTGLLSVYISGTASFTTRIQSAATASWTFTLPATAGTDGYVMKTDGSGNAAWYNAFGPKYISNIGLSSSLNASALTVALKGADGNDPSSTNPVFISFRSSTATTGTPVLRKVTSAVTVTASSGSTLGHASGVTQYVHVWAIDNAGTVELAISGQRCFDEGSLLSTTSEGGAGAADSGTTIYSTSARANVAIRYLGYFKSSQATAGTWATSMSEASVTPDSAGVTPRSEVRLHTGNGHGGSSSGETKVRNFSTTLLNVGTAITYTARTATAGDKFTINEDGVYAISHTDLNSGGTLNLGISLNSSQLTTSIQTITTADALCFAKSPSASESVVAWCGYLRTGDVIRAHGDGGASSASTSARFDIVKVSG